MKASAVTRTLGSIAALLVLALQPAAVSATPNEDRATAQQKAVIEQFDSAHKEYLKTGDLAQYNRSSTSSRKSSPRVSTNSTGRTTRQAQD